MVNLKFEVKDITTIKILEDDFDRSTCEQHTNWNIKKMLKLITCFYIGENLTILENI
jgi:hypothetical protein